MKIGIITFHYNNNFGAALQCHAFQKVLRGMGHTVEVIDFIPENGERLPFWKGWHIRGGGFRKRARQRILQLRYERVANKAFAAFREKYWTLSKRCDSVQSFRDVATKYDAVVCGSDQVWVWERATPYFLDLGDEYTGQRISYAACCGHDRQRKELENKVRPLLNDFDVISVRNTFSQKIVQELTGEEVPIVADPTVLADFEDVERAYELPYKKYILMYCLSADDGKRQAGIIKKIRENLGDLPVVSIVANSCPRKSPVAGMHIYDANPGQWIWLIKHASFVYTDSFHGVLFCCKYKKDFIADYKEEWRSLRLLDAGGRYGFSSRVHEKSEDYAEGLNIQDLDFGVVHCLMREHKDASLDYLNKALV